MTDPPSLALAFAVGVALGVFYFGTLWLVVRRLHRVARPGVWLVVTGILRLATVLVVVAMMAGGRWEHLVAAMVGFVAVRLVLTSRLGRART